VIAYLRSIPAIHTRDLPAPNAAAAAEFPAQMQANTDDRGREIFEGACASCHGWSGVSLLTPYATLTGDRALNDPSAINVAQVILSGESRHTAEGLVLMPSFGDAYSDSEIAAVANYLTGRLGAAASNLTAKDVARYRELASD
jgi:mono/diheme cytochrome c family protein